MKKCYHKLKISYQHIKNNMSAILAYFGIQNFISFKFAYKTLINSCGRPAERKSYVKCKNMEKKQKKVMLNREFCPVLDVMYSAYLI